MQKNIKNRLQIAFRLFKKNIIINPLKYNIKEQITKLVNNKGNLKFINE